MGSAGAEFDPGRNGGIGLDAASMRSGPTYHHERAEAVDRGRSWHAPCPRMEVPARGSVSQQREVGRRGWQRLDTGGLGNDDLIGGPGVDNLNGGPGTDTADYGDDQGPISAELTTGVATDGGGQMDTLESIENVRGSFFDGGAITGDDGPNRLTGDGPIYGAGGDDVLESVARHHVAATTAETAPTHFSAMETVTCLLTSRAARQAAASSNRSTISRTSLDSPRVREASDAACSSPATMAPTCCKCRFGVTARRSCQGRRGRRVDRREPRAQTRPLGLRFPTRRVW